MSVIPVYFHQNKKRRGSRQGKCQPKTMTRTKSNERLKENLIMWLLDTPRREKYEGSTKKRCGTTRTDETERYEWLWRKVEGNWDPHSRRFHHDQTNNTDTLQISETHSSKETKLIRFLRQFITSLVKTDASRWACKKNKRMKSSYRWTVVSTTNGDWVWAIQVDVVIMPNFNPDRIL